jgi:nitrogen fixation/metabolism regulation signal transduction histidine kinase
VHLLMLPIAIVLAFALGAYPIARRLTRRLERLQGGVDQLGKGDLATRVPVEGRDEVAALARSFNRSAERIEELVQSYKLLLANCSHELRTPLARIRLGLERLAADPDDPIRGELTRSVAELDALIDEMLLASRLDALKTLERAEDVDLLAVAAEEAAHFDRGVEGQPVIVHGDPGLLRRMIRNLLANASATAAARPGSTSIPTRTAVRDWWSRTTDRALPRPIATGSSSRSIADAPRTRRWKVPVSASRSSGRSRVLTAARLPTCRSRAAAAGSP